MTDPYQVLSSERGVVRVFTTDLDVEGSSAVTPANLRLLLGEGLELEDSRIEVFPSTALEAMGLSTYLHQGYGIPDEDLQGVAAALDSLKGLVILVASGAFKGQAVTLDPKPGLRFVGLFREPRTAPPAPMAAPEAATGPLGDRGAEPLTTRRGDMWPLGLLVLLIVTGLVLFLVF